MKNVIVCALIALLASLNLALVLVAADRPGSNGSKLWPDVAGSSVQLSDTIRTSISLSGPGTWPPDPPPPIVRDSGKGNAYPYLIITSPELQPVFDDYAAWKRKKGIGTKILTTEEIMYSKWTGDSRLQQKIRECVRWYYTHQGTDWLLIGGDYRHVPSTHVWTGGATGIFTDEFYVSLDFDWNEDGDTMFGESWDHGDITDSYEELAVGRIPAADTFQARIMINKLIAYETDTTQITHYTRVLFTSSSISYPNDDGAQHRPHVTLPERIHQDLLPSGGADQCYERAANRSRDHLQFITRTERTQFSYLLYRRPP